MNINNLIFRILGITFIVEAILIGFFQLGLLSLAALGSTQQLMSELLLGGAGLIFLLVTTAVACFNLKDWARNLAITASIILIGSILWVEHLLMGQLQVHGLWMGIIVYLLMKLSVLFVLNMNEVEDKVVINEQRNHSGVLKIMGLIILAIAILVCMNLSVVLTIFCFKVPKDLLISSFWALVIGIVSLILLGESLLLAKKN